MFRDYCFPLNVRYCLEIQFVSISGAAVCLSIEGWSSIMSSVWFPVFVGKNNNKQNTHIKTQDKIVIIFPSRCDI